MKSSRQRRLDRSAGALVTPTAMRLMRLLVGRPPQSVPDLVRALGVTRTAITEQLGELMAAGFVQRTRGPAVGRGRPRHLYSATQAAMVLLFASNQQLVVPAMWRAIAEVGGEKLTQRVRQRVSRELAEHYRQLMRAEQPEKRLRELGRLMQEEGSVVEVVRQAGGELVLRKRSCPFIAMFEETRAVCCVDQEMMSDVLGVPVRRLACRHDGDPCCEFALGAKDGREAL